MRECECPYLPDKYHYVYYGITEPGSMQEYNPYCPEHGELPREEPGMNDIISRAKELLKDTTPGPWSVSYVDPDYPELQGAPQVENGIVRVPILLSDIYADFSPEDGDLVAAAWAHAKALAEEEWEYGVQSCEYSESAKMWSGWGHFAIPFEKQRTRESCEQFIKGRLDPRFEYRLVRRRVSPVEVVNG